MTAAAAVDFTGVYDDHVARLYGFFVYALGSCADAEDLTQLTFERALRAWELYDAARAPTFTWLLAIARNLLIDHLRASRTARAQAIDDIGLETLAAPADRHSLGLDPDVERALAQLGPRERELIALRFGGDLTGAENLASTMDRMSWGIGLMPEQVWEDPNIPAAPYGSNPATASIGFIDGKAAGSATPLIWAEGQYVRLIRDLQTGALTDQPAITRDRYLTPGPPTNLPVAISSPTSGATVNGSTTVSGTTAPGAQVVISTAQPGSATDSTTVVQTAAPGGQFSASVPTPAGGNVITVAVSSGSHSSGYAQETVTAG